MTIVKFQVNSGQEKKVSSKIVLTQPISVQTDHRLHIQYAQARHGIRKVLFFFWLFCTACGVSVPQPGIKPMPSTLQVQNQGRPRYWYLVLHDLTNSAIKVL